MVKGWQVRPHHQDPVTAGKPLAGLSESVSAAGLGVRPQPPSEITGYRPA